ncbi:PfkB family carbohydrate kinase [Mycoplasma procyoni]|uniref:PfkB family carbohydrate kinase n=1 Tax=Mycoplasma procyoni TaxID=568784 RepID=UPI00197B34F7|nr:PfkB family carbohydrate kinase [Mycoplasma procyoni]MBN3534608.1 family 43 glycosylhydrolase [Mycoplasma procyoni]
MLNKKEQKYQTTLSKIEKLYQEQKNKTKVFDDNSIAELYQKHLITKGDVYYNRLHLSAYSGLLNDPNNYVCHKGTYYIFYQWNPFDPIHANKHQAYFSTTNFREFKHHLIGLRPSNEYDANGIYSGSAISDNKSTLLYYTGNIKENNTYGSKEATSNIMVAKFNDNWKETEKTKKLLFSVDKTKYTRHFRDPYVFKKDGYYYLLLGAQNLESKGKIAVYRSKKADSKFEWIGEIKFINAPKQLEDAFMFECPSFTYNAFVDVLFISTQGAYFYEKDNQNRDVSIYLLGQMNWDTLEFEVESWDLLDLGPDFYAPQIMNNPDDQNAHFIAWAGNPETESVATFDYHYANSLTLPRQFWISPENKLETQYIKKVDYLFDDYEFTSSPVVLDKYKRQAVFHARANKKSWSFKIEGHDEKGNILGLITFEYKRGKLIVNREQMTEIVSKTSPNIITRDIPDATEFSMILDSSLIEIHFNGGQKAFTIKYFIDGDLTFSPKNLDVWKGDIKPISIDWDYGHNVLVPGELVFDEYRIGRKKHEEIGGASFNVAVAIKHQDINSAFCGMVGGKDKNFAKILETRAKWDLDGDNIFWQEDKYTTRAIVKLNKAGERSFEFIRGADKDLNYERIKNKKFSALALVSATAFLGGDLFQTYRKLAQKAKTENKPIFFDPNYREALYKDQLDSFLEKTNEFIEYADFVKFSKEELLLVTNTEDLESALQKLAVYENKVFLVTLGKEGTLVYLNQKHFVVPSRKAEQIDTTGAGDAFFGTFIAKWLGLNSGTKKKLEFNLELIEKVFDSNVVASYVVEKVGALSLPPKPLAFQKQKELWAAVEQKFKKEFINEKSN